MAPRVAVAATTILAQLLAPLFCPFAARSQILSPLTACACVVSFAILRRSLAAGAFASCLSCRCLCAGSHGRMGSFLGWVAGTLERARAPGYGSGHKPAWLFRAPRGAKRGAPECPKEMVVLTTFTSLRLAATPPQCLSHAPSALSQVRLVGELLVASQERHHYCHPGGHR